MKKNLIRRAALSLLTVLFITTALTSCQSTGKKKPAEEFTVHWDSPQFQIGEIEAQINTTLGLGGKIRKISIPVLYFPQEDAVVLRFRPEFTTYHQCWSGRGRMEYIEALKKYNEDYDGRILDIRDRKSNRKYGLVQGYLIWRQFQYTVRARGNMMLELGYTFKDKAPYFLINQLSTEYIDAISRDNNKTSPVLPLYFTRAQAAELATLFDREFLDGLSRSGSIPNIKSGLDDDY